MNVSTNQKHLWALALILGLAFQINAQCLIDWSFKNVSDIPGTCNVPWSEEGISMQMIPTTPGTSCSTGSGCAFSIIQNAPNQYNFLNILSGALEVNIPDPANFYTLSFKLNEFSGGCQTVRYFNGNMLVLEVEVIGNYYITDPAVTSGLTFDKISIAVTNSQLYGFDLKYSCNDGAPITNSTIDFEEIPQGVYGGSGSSGPFLNSQGVDLYVSNENGDNLSPSAAQYFIEHTRPFVFGHGNNFFWPQHPVKFDFTVLPNPVTTVYFDIVKTDLDIILKVNGDPAFIGQIDFVPTNIAANVTFTPVGPLGNTSGHRYQLEGPIENFVIGGAEFFMDNIGFVQGQTATCNISSMILQNQDCNTDGTIDLDFYMTVQDAPSTAFNYYVNGIFAGTENINPDNVYRVENLIADNNTEHTFSICIDDAPNCCADFIFYIPNCSGTSCLDFEGFLQYGGNFGNVPGDTVALRSNDGTVATVQNYFNADSISSFQTLSIRPNQSDLHNPESINLDLDFSGINGTVNSLTFQSTEFCCIYFGLNNAYTYLESMAELPSALPSNFTYINQGNYWTIEGPAIDNFSIGGGNFEAGDFCYTLADADCAMAEATVTTTDCNNLNEVSATFDFIHTGTTDSFSITGNGNNYGVFAYADLPITIDGFAADGTTIYELGATDLIDPDCSIAVDFGPLDCPPPDCGLDSGSFVVQEDCDPNGNVSVEIDFFHVGSADTFTCIQNGVNIGNYAYADLPIIFPGFDGTAQTDNVVQIIDQDDDNCTLTIEIGIIDCSFVCGINEIWVDNQTCNNDGTVNFDLLLIVQPITSDFELYLNGNSIGIYNVNPTNWQYSITGVNVIPNEDNLLTACAIDNPNCCQTRIFTGIDCPVNNCAITNMAITDQECDNGIPYGTLQFAISDPTNDQWEYWINGEYQGIDLLNLNNNGIHTSTISLADANPTGLNEITVCINDNSDCCHTVPFQVITCPDPCNLSGLEILNISDCDPNNMFNVEINLTHTGVGEQFTLAGNGQNYGTYFYSDLPLSIGMGPGDNSTSWELIATDVDDADCSTSADIGVVSCAGANCAITDLQLLEINCDGNQPFGTIEFNYSDPGNDNWEWWINGEYQGIQNLDPGGQTSLTVSLADGQLGIDNLIEVCINDQPNCCQSIFFDQINCSPCEITNLTLTDQQCDGSVFAYINLSVNNPGNDNWEWWINGQYQGLETFNTSGSYHVNLQNANPNGINLLQVCVNDNPNCCQTIEFELIDCSDPCIIEVVEVEILDCNNDGIFNVNLFANSSVNSGNFNLTGNGINYGQYNYADLPILVEGFEGNGNTVYELIMTDAQFPDCQNEVVFGPITCNTNNNCSVTDLTVTDITCDGNMAYGYVNFQVANPGNNLWEWWINGTYQGSENFNANNSYLVNLDDAVPGIINIIQVCVNDNPDCCQTIEFELLDCSDPCIIEVVEVEILDCNNDGIFNVNLFANSSVNSGNFNLTGNGINYGQYNYADLPILVEGFEGNGNTVYELIMTDAQFPDCQNEVVFGPITCNTNNNCSVTDLTVTDITCDGNIAYGYVNFQVANPGNNLWEWWINGTYQGSENFNANNSYFVNLDDAVPGIINIIQVCANDNPDCCQTIEFETVDCSDICEIGELNISIGDCNPNQVVTVTVDFDYANTSDQFTLQGNGINYGTFSYTDLPIDLSFVGDGTTIYELVAIDVNNNDCQNFIEFGPLDCNPNGDCIMSDLTLNEISCIGDFSEAILFFEVDNPGNDFWEYWINGEYVDVLPLQNNNEYLIPLSGALPGQPNTIQVCINDNPDCCSSLTFDVETCIALPGCVWIQPFAAGGSYGNSTGETPGFNVPPHQPAILTLEEYQINTNDPVLFGDLYIPDFSPYTGIIHNIGLNTNFQNFINGVNQVSIEIYGGCCFYLGINGENEYFANLADIPSTLSNGYSVSMTAINTSAGDGTLLTINGAGIEDFFIAGTDVPFRAICYEIDPVTNCEIGELVISIGDCNPNQVVSVSVDFDYAGSSDQFTLQGNGVNYGTFNYTDLPIDLGLQGDGTTIYELVAIDVNNNDCQNFIEFGPLDCDPNSDCSITELTLTDVTCDGNIAYGYVNFQVSNPGNDLWEWWINGVYQGSEGFNPNNSYHINLEDANPDILNILQVCVNDQPDCCQTIEFEIPNCPDNCEIGDLNISLGDCNPNQTMEVTLDFDYANTSDQFTLQGNGQNYGTFNYDQLPITIGLAADGTTIYEFVVTDVNNNDCQNFIEFGPLDCDPNGDCEISELLLTEISCVGDNHSGLLSFEVDNPGNDFWEYWINGEYVGFFLIDNNPYGIELTGAIPDQPNTLQVCINDNPNCCTSITFEVENCNAQSGCVAIQQFPAGGSYGSATGEDPGFILPTNPPVILTLEEYQISANDPILFGNLSIPDFSPWDGTLFDIAMNASFENFSNGVDQVSIEIYGGCCFFLGINGENNYYASLADIPAVLPNGYSTTLTAINTSGGDGTLLTISGAGIENFFIGGTDVPFRNLCYDLEPTVPTDNCLDFQDLQAGTVLDNGNATVPLDLFTQENVSVTLDDCGPTDFFQMEVRDDEFCNLVPDGENAIFLQGASLNYNFTGVSPIPNEVSFNFCGEGILNINGNDIVVDFDTDIPAGGINLGNGYYLHVTEIPNVTFGYTLTLSGGVIETLTVCGIETSVGPPCFDFVPDSTDDCYGFENLVDGGFYELGNNEPSMTLYDSAPLKVSLINDVVPNGSVGITSQITSTVFNGAIGNYAFLFGAMEFDFSGLTDPTEFVSFDFAGTDFSISVNNEPEINFPGMQTLDTLLIAAPGVILYFHRESSNPMEGQVSLFGEVENLVIASEEILLDNICYYLEIQAPDVWPGDINSDNIADHCDLIYLGIANGTSGPARGNPTADWEGQGALDWNQSFLFENTNYKHADANGDGKIDIADYQVLADNLGKVHGPEPDWQGTPGTPTDPPLYIDLNANGPLVAGEPFAVPIILGSDAIPVTDIYGLAFSIEFDEADLDLSNTTLSLDNSWLGSDLWKIEKLVATDGRVDVGITRTTRVDTSGNGEIAEFTGIIDNLVGKEIQVSITNVKALTHDETPVLIFAQSNSGSVTTNTDKDDLEDGLHIFPVPTTDVLYIRNYSERDIQAIKIFNVLGQQMLLDRAPRKLNQYHLSSFASGTYFVELHFIGEKITRKIQVMND